MSANIEQELHKPTCSLLAFLESIWLKIYELGACDFEYLRQRTSHNIIVLDAPPPKAQRRLPSHYAVKGHMAANRQSLMHKCFCTDDLARAWPNIIGSKKQHQSPSTHLTSQRMHGASASWMLAWKRPEEQLREEHVMHSQVSSSHQVHCPHFL